MGRASMGFSRWAWRNSVASMGVGLWWTACCAAAPNAGPPSVADPDFQSRAISEIRTQAAAVARATAAVVGVQASVLDDAHSIASLGSQRQGSGVVIDASGLVLTIGYLILEADHIDLVFNGERKLPARVVAYDLATGFGLLQPLTPARVAPVTLGVSSQVSGDQALLVATGGELGELSLVRMVSRRPFSGYWEYHIEGALFTAPPMANHSGAALFNPQGDLLGLGSLVVSDALGPGQPRLAGNMFVPIDLLKPILAEMVARGSSSASTRAWLGLNCVEDAGTVRVVRTSRHSPAERAGVQAGDRIVSIDGTPVNGLEALYRTLWTGKLPERLVVLEIRRGDETQTLTLQSVNRMATLSRPKGI
jgi:serine protease Do